MKSSAILLSRQPLRPCRLTPWVSQTIKAVQWIKENHYCLITSVGMQTWEFLIHMAQSHEIEQLILIPALNEPEFQNLKESTIDQFRLNHSLVRFRAIMPGKNDCQSLDLLYRRDSEAVFEADVLIPVSIRAKGHMECLMQNKRKGSVIHQFKTQHPQKRHPIAYKIEPHDLPHDTVNIRTRYVIHWTRASNGPWPSEKKHAYFSSVAQSEYYPRNAFQTLQNIIKTGKIMASSNHMPRGIATVSFSGLAPDMILPLMKWRSRYRQMSFEPYGIGIEKTTASQLGIVPVHYYRKKEYPKDKPPWQLQSQGMKTDWKQEAEYRYPGDFNLSDIEPQKVAFFCHTRDEADFIEKSFGIRSYAFAGKK